MAERSFPCAVWTTHFCFKHTSVNSAFGTGLCKNGHYRLSQRMPGLLVAEVPGGGSLRIGSLITTELIGLPSAHHNDKVHTYEQRM